MVEVIPRELGLLQIGAPQVFQNLTMFALLDGRAGAPDYVTLDEALRAGTTEVTEVSDSGSVPELRFRNGGEWAVLLLDGEELIGAKQNRVLNLSILAPAGKEIRIPVSCVEAGRWSRISPMFSAAPRAHYAAGRAKKMAAVSRSLATEGPADRIRARSGRTSPPRRSGSRTPRTRKPWPRCSIPTRTSWTGSSGRSPCRKGNAARPSRSGSSWWG